MVRSVLICPLTVHNEWLSAQGDVLGTKGAAAFHGAVTEEILEPCLCPRKIGFHLARVPGWAISGRPLRAGPLAGIGPSYCHVCSQCRAAQVGPHYVPWLASMIDRSVAGPLLGRARREAGPLDSEGTRSAPSKEKEVDVLKAIRNAGHGRSPARSGDLPQWAPVWRRGGRHKHQAKAAGRRLEGRCAQWPSSAMARLTWGDGRGVDASRAGGCVGNACTLYVPLPFLDLPVSHFASGVK